MSKKTEQDAIRAAYMLRNTPLDPPVKGGSAKAKRTAARMAITQILYQIEVSEKDAISECAEFMAHRAGYEFDGLQLVPPDADMVNRILPKIFERIEDIDSMITGALRPSNEIEIPALNRPVRVKKHIPEKVDDKVIEAKSEEDIKQDSAIETPIPELTEAEKETEEAEKTRLKGIEKAAQQERREKRLGVLLRAILRAAIYELLVEISVDKKIIVSDYLSVTAAFYDKGEVALVNGILDKLARQLRD